MLFIYFAPIVLVGFFFISSYIEYIRIYRKVINPQYPLLMGETESYLTKNPSSFLKKLPLIPFLRWKIIFEHHKDKKLNLAATKTRKWFWVFLFVLIVNFVLHTTLLVWGGGGA